MKKQLKEARAGFNTKEIADKVFPEIHPQYREAVVYNMLSLIRSANTEQRRSA